MALTKVANTLLDFTGGFVAGNVSFPAITTVGDTNTGIYFPAADTIAFAEGGVESARIDSVGNFGLGFTPSVQYSGIKSLQIGSTTNLFDQGVSTKLYHNAYTAASGDDTHLITGYAQAYLMPSNGNHIWYISTSGTAGNTVSFTQAMTLGADGNMILGGTSPTTSSGYTSLSINNATNSGYLVLQSNGTNKSDWYVSGGTVATLRGVAVPLSLESTGANHIKFETNGSERARIDSSGQFYLGTAGANTPSSTRTGTAWGFGSGSNNYWLNAVNATSTANHWSFINGNGAVGSITTSGSNTTYSTSSDYRLKESIAPITGALNVVSQLNPVTYKWKVDGSDGQGFIAHELAEVIPDCVIGEKDAVETQQYEISPAVPATFDEDGNVLTPAVKAVMGEREVPKYQGIDTSFLVATLTAAIQEQQALITQLQADVAALKGATP